MKQVLWPKYLLGGMLQRSGGGMGDEESQGFGRDLRGLVGRWPDADGILQGGLSEGLKDWDLWYVWLCLLSLSWTLVPAGELCAMRLTTLADL